LDNSDIRVRYAGGELGWFVHDVDLDPRMGVGKFAELPLTK